jgi:predicted homoserine dehydrogenase-like protein
MLATQATTEGLDMAEPIRFGVLGCANIARKVIRAMTLAVGVEACAVGSRSLDKAKQFAAELKEKTVRNASGAHLPRMQASQSKSLEIVFLKIAGLV